MRELTRLWHALDEVSALVGVEAQWRDWLGDEFDLVRGLLRPEQDRATSYLCSSPGGAGCPRRVVVHGEDDIVAVCGCSPAECDPIKLAPIDVIVHRLDETKLGKVVAQALGFKPARGGEVDLPGVTTIGTIDVAIGRRAPVLLVLQASVDDERHVIERLLASSRQTSPLMVVPAELPLDLSRQIEASGAAVVVCADLLAWDASGLIARDGAQSIVDAARARMAQHFANSAAGVMDRSASGYRASNSTEGVSADAAQQVCESLREANGLVTMTDASLSDGVFVVGRLARRSKSVPVVWMPTSLPALDEACRGIHQKLGEDGLVVLLEDNASPRLVEPGVVLLARGEHDDLQLWRALDLLDPSYGDGRIKSKTAIFDDVAIEFAHVPGERHVVRIAGSEISSFGLSDQKFLRLLCLAAARRADPDVDGGGWLDKFKLEGDEKDHDLEALRRAMGSRTYCSLPQEERRALIKSSPKRDGRIRLAIDPRHVRFDTSLAGLGFISELPSTGTKKTATPGSKAYTQNMQQSRKISERLLKLAQQLGIDVRPGEGGVEPKRTPA